MEILFVLVPVSLLLIGLAIAAFLWAANSGQFEDLERQGYEILFDEDKAMKQDEAEKGDNGAPQKQNELPVEPEK